MRYAIIVAGGSASRFGKDKLNAQLFGKSVLTHSVDVFKDVADVVIVVGQRVEGTVFAEGGDTRFQSVKNGLRLLANDAQGVVAIHDGARPFITKPFVERLFLEAERHGSAVPSLPVTDTIYQKNEYGVEKNRHGVEKCDRNALFTVQTPQVFDLAKLRHAVESATADYPDESTLYLETYGEVNFVDGLRSNTKVTYAEDLPEYKIGVGFDVHPFASGDCVILGGVSIPFNKKLKGHSDADALCHAVCDAVLSASGSRDIGHQFPDTDPRYKGIDSTKLLARCVEMAAESGYEIVNVSAVVICQEPKISPYIEKMAEKLSKILKISVFCVNISATTTEHLGALGNGDGIAVSAEALLKRS
ncbi:MAG: 2-C-methyl-D-erythritol 2,4-cyclodiphosphate synthase [Clostridiales bacterium]|nr:2-C-methyl-D-erythritol 2,4-cyclodiphosphate synthase [Clostridiales bacterium]